VGGYGKLEKPAHFDVWERVPTADGDFWLKEEYGI
jgi:hypothetical protein